MSPSITQPYLLDDGAKNKYKKMKKNEYTTLAKTALSLGLPKSKLQYYDYMGLIKSEFTAGKTRFYNKKKLLSTIHKINKWKDNNLSLKDIKNKLK